MNTPNLLDNLMLQGIDEKWITPIKEDSSMEFKTYIEIPVTVHYDYQPEERQIMFPNDKAHPGFPACVTINSVEMDQTDELIDIGPGLSVDDFDGFEEDIMNSLRGDE
jgi:hypothetical protein